MKLEEKDIELLDAFWRGELEEASRAELEQRLQNDVEFQKAAAEIQQLQHDLRELQLRQWRNQLIEIEQEAIPLILDEPPSWWRRYGWMIIAGVLLLALLFILKWKNVASPQPQPAAAIAMEAYRHVSFVGSTLGVDAGAAARLYEEERDYQRAEPLLQALFKESKDSTDLFFAALAAVGSNQGKKAIPILEALYNSSEYALLRENVEWNLALAYLEVNAINQGRKLLKQIEAGKGRWAPDAESVLNKLAQMNESNE